MNHNGTKEPRGEAEGNALLPIAPFSAPCFFGGILAFLLTAGCAQNELLEVVTFTGPTMGTHYTVRVVASPRKTEELHTAIDTRLALVNRRMSTYDPESEVSRFNRSESVGWFGVSPETALVVAYALEVADQTNGAYDPTVGPLVNLWGFGPEAPSDTPPNDEAITAARMRVGYHRLEVRADPPAVRKSEPMLSLDLSSVAKGHGVDVVAELLEEEDIPAYMVEIGGEVRTLGAKPEKQPWRIGVEKPAARGRSVQRVLELSGQSVATSGDYRNFFEHAGQRYSHTIDPRTGRPVKHLLTTVSVIATTCREADALATALLVLGPESGYDWAEEHGVAALLVNRPDTDFKERATPAWNQLSLEVEPSR